MRVNSDIHIVVAAIPFYGHTRPVRSLTQSLRKLGFPVTFIGGHTFQKSIEAIEGVEFVRLKGKADYDTNEMGKYFPEITKLPRDANMVVAYLVHVLIQPMADQYETLQDVLKRPQLANKKVIVLSEYAYFGTMPMLLGSPGGKRVPCICVNSTTLCIISKDVAPFGSGLPPQGLEKNLKLNDIAIQEASPAQAELERIVKFYNCTLPLLSKHPMDAICRAQDIFYQLSTASMEFPRSDLPENVSFIGCVAGNNDLRPIPEWFQSFVIEDGNARPLVVVTAGTIAVDSQELIIPTIEACRNLPVRLLICAGPAVLPQDYMLPENTRCTEWIAFESLFEHTSIVVSNGGYGGICQFLSAGIPMVVSGTSEEKMEGCSRAEMTGAAINLRTQNPSAEQLESAIKRILEEKTFKEKAMGLKMDFVNMDPVGSILKGIDDLVEKWYPN